MIYIDDREPDTIPTAFPNGTPTCMMRLEEGDFMFFVNGPGGPGSWQVGVERKTVTDFLASSRSGRLGDQVRRMSEIYDAYWVMIEGVTRLTNRGTVETLISHRLADPEVEYSSGTWKNIIPEGRPVLLLEWEGYITSTELVQGARTRRSRSLQETATMVAAIYSWGTNKEFEEHHSMLRPFHPASPLRKPNLMQKWLDDLHGMGPKTLKSAMKRFKTPSSLAFATVEDWLEVEGIGQKRAEDFVRQIHGG